MRQGISRDGVKYHVGNILGKLALVDRRALRRWPGVPRARRAAPVSGAVTLGPIGQVARRVADIAAASDWYGRVLGLPHLYSFGTLAFFDCDGVRLMLSADAGAASESILYFTVTDIHAAAAALAGRGAVFRGAPHMIHRHDDGTEEWMTFFDDNEGRPLGLMARV